MCVIQKRLKIVFILHVVSTEIQNFDVDYRV